MGQIRVITDKSSGMPREVVCETIIRIGSGETHVYRAVIHSIEVKSTILGKVLFRVYVRDYTENTVQKSGFFGFLKGSTTETVECDTLVWSYNSDENKLIDIDERSEYWKAIERRLLNSKAKFLHGVVKDSFTLIRATILQTIELARKRKK